jgi:hypothetical protein
MDFIVMGMSLMRFGGITAANWKNAVSTVIHFERNYRILNKLPTIRKITT